MGRASAITTSGILLLLLMVPVIYAANAGDVNFSVDGLAISPSSPSEGDDVEVTATLTNNISTSITNIDVSLHPDSQANTAFHTETVVISGGGFVQVTGTWSDVPFGTHAVVLVVTHNGSTNSVSKQFEVAGKIDLIASNISITPATDLHQGDVVNLSVDVTNQGNLDSPASHLLVQLDGATLTELAVSPLLAGFSTTIQTSFNAPLAGNHQISAIANSASDGITESDTGNNAATPLPFTVFSSPDYLHHQQPNPEITVETVLGTLSGPWTLSGQILRMGGTGDSTITVGIYLVDGELETSVISFDMTFTESATLQNWEQELTLSQMPSLEPGVHTLRVRIDPSRQVPQSIQFNDDLDTQITIHPEPNVVVSPHASASSDSILAGEQVNFDVTVINTGSIAVIGDLSASFDGNSLQPLLGLGIPGGEERTFTFTVVGPSGEEGALQFSASWEANAISYDSNINDNTAFGSVTLHSNLRLRFLQESESWTPAHTPLVVGNTYTYTIDIVSDEGTGSEVFTCLNHGEGEVLSTTSVNFTASVGTNSILCSFKADEAGSFELYIVPAGSSVATWTAAWSISATSNDGPQTESSNFTASTLLFIFAGLLLIIVLAAAIKLTRVDSEEGERETYDYCPSCDGEIEGDEEFCPYCEFDLVEGLSQFHDCESCNSNIPDVMEYCPYCGTVQDVSSFYERRTRKEIAHDEVEEEVEEDDDEIVRGAEDYGDAISEMGYAEEQLESDWDEHLTEAEQEIDAAIADREQQEVDLTEEEAEDELVITSMRSAHETEKVDLDDIIGDKEGRRHLQDSEVELSASDADIRADIFDITGEDGILPGQEVEVELIPDNTVVGNVLKDKKEVTDFSVDDGESPPPAKISETEPEPVEKRRRPKRRRKDSED